MGLLSVVALNTGCDEPAVGKTAPQAPIAQQTDKPARPVPKTIEEVAKLGVPVFPGSSLSDGADHTRLDDRAYARVYFTKMYAPAEVAAVLGFYMKAVKDARRQGGVESEQVKGKSPDGADLDVRIAPAADHTKSLVMVWMTETKMPR